MSKSVGYRDCPEDIKENAKSIVKSFGHDPALLEGAIAAALFYERQRSTKKAASTRQRP